MGDRVGTMVVRVFDDCDWRLKRVLEERAVTGGEGGDEVVNTWVGYRRPCGLADVSPEHVIGA